MLIRPRELKATFVHRGFTVDRTIGLGQHGVHLENDLSLGGVPSTAIVHMGIAHR